MRRGQRGGKVVVLLCAAYVAQVAMPDCTAMSVAYRPGGMPQDGRVRIALTRQAGENGKLRAALKDVLQGFPNWPPDAAEVVEAPCIEHADGPDLSRLRPRLEAGGLGVVLLTSPEAARVFLGEVGICAGDLQLPPLATVGKGTAGVLREAGLSVAFAPSVANAEALASELPSSFGPCVLYPSSALASSTLQDGLTARGFTVERLDTYTTRPVERPGAEVLKLMAETHVATFGSPSAVRAWAAHSSSRPVAACIGDTTAEEAKAVGFRRIHAPAKPGVSEWAQVTAVAAHEMFLLSTASDY